MRATVRLPYATAQIAARHAARNGWSMSQYIAWCVDRMNWARERDRPTTPEATGGADGIDRIHGEAVSLSDMLADDEPADVMVGS